MSIYLLGLEKLERNANKLIKDVTSGKTKLLLEGATIIKDRIKEKAPVGPPTDKHPGSLKAAAYAKAYPATMAYPASAFAGIRPRAAPHGHLVEFGHGGPHPAPAHPFVRPAIDETLPLVHRHIEEGLKEIIEAGG
jgi:HK97 gp10 family phage protein